MKKILSFFCVVAMTSQLAIAHGGGHVHAPINSQEALQAASDAVKAIVEQNIEIAGEKLDAVWANIPDSSKSISRRGEGYYIVSLKNGGKTLYILLSEQGEFYDANFNGIFEGLEE